METLGKIRVYLAETGMPPTLFGRLAARDPRLVGDLMNGREPRAAMRARIDAFIASHPAPSPAARDRTPRPCSNAR